MDCYVYYRVSSSDTDAARLAVAQLFALTATRFGAKGCLQWRVDASAGDTASGVTTWMERYDNVNTAFVAALPGLVAECGLAAWVQGERHVECFANAPDMPTPCA